MKYNELDFFRPGKLPAIAAPADKLQEPVAAGCGFN